VQRASHREESPKFWVNKTVLDLEFSGTDAIKLLKRIARYMHHPLRKLRAELFLVYYDGKISREKFEKLYEQTEYEYGGPDEKEEQRLRSHHPSSPTNPHPRGTKQLLMSNKE